MVITRELSDMRSVVNIQSYSVNIQSITVMPVPVSMTHPQDPYPRSQIQHLLQGRRPVMRLLRNPLAGTGIY